jgi:uncharacterized protein (TIGR02145 family)
MKTRIIIYLIAILSPLSTIQLWAAGQDTVWSNQTITLKAKRTTAAERAAYLYWQISSNSIKWDNCFVSSSDSIVSYNMPDTFKNGQSVYFRAKLTGITGCSEYTTEKQSVIFRKNVITLKDFDGNVYNAVTIGPQTWMAENLKVSHYRNGEIIPMISIASSWIGNSAGAYCYYNNDVTTVSKYGYLYNWFGATDNRKICPLGWHLPTDNEWEFLINYLGGESVAGGKMKAKGITDWTSPNTGADNTSGFNASPSGYRSNSNGSFLSGKSNAYFWSSNEYSLSPTSANTSYLYYLNMYASKSSLPKGSGASIRCVKDTTPALSTTLVVVPTQTTANTGGAVTTDGGIPVKARGVVWSTNPNPTLANSKTIDSLTASNTYTSQISGLTPNTTYYLRAYATNNLGTGYGNEIKFVTTTWPTLTTNAPSTATQNSVVCGGNISSNGGSTVLQRGVCWSTSPNPTITSNTTKDGTGNGSFTSKITGLVTSTTYYVRAYATNDKGTSYGNEISFTTLEPTGTTGYVYDSESNYYYTIVIGNQKWMASNLKSTKYTDGSTILGSETYLDATYGRKYTWAAAMNGKTTELAQGACPDYWHIPSANDYNILITNLGGTTVAGGKLRVTGVSYWSSPNTTASNSSGFNGYGGGYSDTLGGAINKMGELGLYWSSTSNKDTTSNAFNLNLFYDNANASVTSGLKSKLTTIRCIKDSLGTKYVPRVGLNPVFDIRDTSAKSYINIISDGGLPLSAKGVCWSTTENPTIANSKTSDGAGVGKFTSTLNGLSPNTTYFLRSYATNSLGTTYGKQISFTTLTGNKVTDIDGNVYNTVKIKNQEWLASNLRTKKYSNGLEITNNTFASAWSSATSGQYCNYNNDTLTAKEHGRLYNYMAITSPYKLCPSQWHTPTNADWQTLIDSLGSTYSALKLSDLDTTKYTSTKTIPDYVCGFSAQPSGYRDNSGYFQGMGSYTYFGTATEYSSYYYYWYLYYYNAANSSYTNKNYGMSVRCVKDQIPTVTTNVVSNINQSTATCGGNTTADGGASIMATGVCWNTSPVPTINNSKTVDSTKLGTFVSAITGLTAGTVYYVRAYATNSAGTAYGAEYSFKTEKVSVAEKEPNDTWQTADTLKIETPITGRIGMSSDLTDYYIFKPASNGYVYFVITNLNPVNTANGTIGSSYIYDRINGASLTYYSTYTNPCANASSQTSSSVFVNADSTYFIKVNYYSTGYTAFYKLNTFFTPSNTADVQEPNNTSATAKSITIGTDLVSHIGVNNDIDDWYKFTAETSGQLNMTIKNLSPEGTGNAFIGNEYLFDANLNPSYYSLYNYSLSAGIFKKFNSFFVGKDSTYYINIKHYASGNATPYSISTSITSAGTSDIGEPNKTSATATAITVGTPVVAHIGVGTDDVDWYTFTPSANGFLTFTITNLNPLNTESSYLGDVYLYDNPLNAASTSISYLVLGANGKSTSSSVSVGTGIQYYIKVTRHAIGYAAPYKLETKLTLLK